MFQIDGLIQNIRVSVVSQKVAERISRSIPAGTLTNIFEHSFNLETHDQFLINVGSRRFPPSPRSILLSDHDFGVLSTKVRIGMATLFLPEEIYFPESKVRLLTEDATVFDPRINFWGDLLPYPKIKRNLLEAADQLKSRRRMGMASPLSGYFTSRSISAGFSMRVDENKEWLGEVEVNDDLIQLRKSLRKRIDSFLMHLGQWRLGEAVEQALGIVGLGFGLTPSGDDFLSGFLLAGRALSSRDRRTSLFLEKMGEEICKGARDKTTSISLSMIEDASAGDFSELAIDFFRSVLQLEDKERIRTCTDRLYSIGATSGEDFLNGMMIGILIFTGSFTGKKQYPVAFD
jgi:hypothetical protein